MAGRQLLAQELDTIDELDAGCEERIDTLRLQLGSKGRELRTRLAPEKLVGATSEWAGFDGGAGYLYWYALDQRSKALLALCRRWWLTGVLVPNL